MDLEGTESSLFLMDRRYEKAGSVFWEFGVRVLVNFYVLQIFEVVAIDFEEVVVHCKQP